jgi:hypothetical protein
MSRLHPKSQWPLQEWLRRVDGLREEWEKYVEMLERKWC